MRPKSKRKETVVSGKLCNAFFQDHAYVVRAPHYPDFLASNPTTAIDTARDRYGTVYAPNGSILWPSSIASSSVGTPVPTVGHKVGRLPSFAANDVALNNYAAHAEDLEPDQVDKQEE